MDEGLRLFLLESLEGLQKLEQELIELETDPGNVEVRRAIFRRMHTIKGTCGFLGLSRLERVVTSSVDAIRAISGIIKQINDIQNSIASAVKEQMATTHELGRNVIEAARSSAEITQNITAVAMAARDTSSGAAGTRQAAGELARMSAELQALVAQFRIE